MAVVLDILTPDSFYKKPHGVIFEAMMHLFERSQPVDILTAVSYTHLRAHETVLDLVCRLLLEKNKFTISQS